MAGFGAKLKDLIILNGQTSSRVVNSEVESWDAMIIGIIAPAGAEATEIHVSDTETGTFVPLNDGTNDVAGPAASKAVEYDCFAFPFWKLVAAAGVGADRTFKCYKKWNAY